MTFFLVIDHKFRISPYFRYFSTFPSLFRENYYFPPYFDKFSPLFYTNSPTFYILYVYFPPTLTMMHLCITQCTYWTPLIIEVRTCRNWDISSPNNGKFDDDDDDVM